MRNHSLSASFILKILIHFCKISLGQLEELEIILALFNRDNPFWFVNDMPEQLPEDKTVDNRQKTLEGTAIDVIVKYADGSTQTKIINVDLYQSFENDKYGSSQIIFSYKD